MAIPANAILVRTIESPDKCTRGMPNGGGVEVEVEVEAEGEVEGGGGGSWGGVEVDVVTE